VLGTVPRVSPPCHCLVFAQRTSPRRITRIFLKLRAVSSQFENNYFTEMCSGFEAGSYLRLIDFVHHSTVGESNQDGQPPTACRPTSLLVGGMGPEGGHGGQQSIPVDHNKWTPLQGYLAHKNPPPPRTLQGYLAHKKPCPRTPPQQDYAQGPVAVVGGAVFPTEPGMSTTATPLLKFSTGAFKRSARRWARSI